MNIQVMCGTCSGRIHVEFAEDATPAAFVTALKNAISDHDETVHPPVVEEASSGKGK